VLPGSAWKLWAVRDIQPGEQVAVPHLDLAGRILAGSPAVICAKDLEGRYLYVNPVFETLTGQAAAEFIGKSDFDIFAPERAEYYVRTDKLVLASATILTYQEVGPASIGFFTVTKYPLRSAEGAICGVVSYAQPPHSDSPGLESVQSDFLRRAFSGVPQAILICDHSGAVIVASEAALALLHCDADRVVTHPVSAFMLDHEAERHGLHDVAVPARAVLRRPDGSTFPAAVSTISFEVTNTIRWSLFIFRDCSEEVRIENELRESQRKFAVDLLHSQEEERRRTARNLHDGFAQTLFAISLGLTRLRGGAHNAARTEEMLDDLVALTETAQRDIRTLSHILHPPLDERGGLAGTIEWFVRGFERRSGLTVSYQRPASPARLPQETEVALFRVLQESCSNVVRHSRATQVTIRLLQTARGVTLEIEDDGNGAVESRALGPRDGIGLASMRERMNEVGGTLEVRDAAKGAIVRATVPISRDS
jgi:two-component system NarL family sensor kinase